MLVYQRVNSGTIVVNFVDAQLGNHGDTQQKNIPIRLGLTWFDQGRREGTMGIQPTSMNYIVIELYSYTYIYICFFHSCHSYGIYLHRHFAVGHHDGMFAFMKPRHSLREFLQATPAIIHGIILVI